ncbi:hypothetical protein ASZ78_008864 [Callipepla squamata]|uniref:Dynein heavy chain C-terminal domain-containing protein n=1 Tax=Callipepla squamata TaxID=9009 RepID=A0A226NE62_CALSU|nr:hypothetical protein ASZ78_008864 [Callipepla squamata]
MQKVITVVRNSLNDLKLAIEGTIIMSEASINTFTMNGIFYVSYYLDGFRPYVITSLLQNLRDALDNIYDARIPQVWKRVSWDSSTLGFWFTEFLERNAQFSTWIYEGRPNVFWMTGFFNPQVFFCVMYFHILSAQEGVYIHGLYLEGAGWDRRNSKLIESTPKMLFVQLPVVHIFAVETTGPKDPKLYVCPIYKKPSRTDLNYITVIYLKTVVPPDHWILRGVALLCDIT